MKPTIFFLFLLAFACAQDSRTVTEPTIPPAAITLRALLQAPGGGLSESDESKLDTARIQRALDECPPGRAVVLAADGARNAFLSGPLELRKGVTLVVDAGAILLASRNPRDYDRTEGSCGIITKSGKGCKPLFGGDGVQDAAIMGDGIIDGRGGSKMLGQTISWWDLAEEARKKGSQNCPRIVQVSRCDNFRLYRITLRNSPNFHVAYYDGDGFTAWGVRIYAPGKGARNTDGIDPANSRNVTITHCFIHTGDDNVAIKAGGKGKPATNMTISHNHFYAGHGMSIGSETDAGASAIRVTDLSVDSADNAIRIKSNSSRGGMVRDVVYEDVCIRNTKHPILMDTHYSFYGEARDKLPTFTGIALRGVRIQGGGTVTLDGYDAAHRLGIAFDNVILDNPAAIKVVARHADVALGPGPVNLEVSGEDLNITGHAGEGKGNSCEGKFVPFPAK